MAGAEKLLFHLKVFDHSNSNQLVVDVVVHSKYFDLGDSNNG